MADRTLRGMRLGSQSMQTEEGVEFAERQRAQYRTADGEVFDVIFAADAELPDVWESPKSGREGVLLAPDGTPVDVEVGGGSVFGAEQCRSRPADLADGQQFRGGAGVA